MSTRAHTGPKFFLNGFIAPGSEHERDPFVWVGSLTTGEVTKRSPKNISISRGLYDGRGGFEEPDATIEAHLASKDRISRVIGDTQIRSHENRRWSSDSCRNNTLPGVASGAHPGLDGCSGTLGQ